MAVTEPLRGPLTRRPADARRAALIGLHDVELVVAVHGAVSGSGFSVVDVVVSPRELVAAASFQRPELILATLDVLGVAPDRTVRRLLTASDGAAVVVLSPLGTVPLWLLEAGAHAVLDQREIGELKRVLKELWDR